MKNSDVILRGLPDRDVYRFFEVAQYLKIDERTIRTYIDHGHLKKVKLRGVVWIPRYSLIEFMQGIGVRLGVSSTEI